MVSTEKWNSPRSALFAATLAALVLGFRTMLLNHAPAMFVSAEEDMSFAWFVPVFSLYIVWRERRAIAASLGAPSWGGVAATLPFLFLGFLGVRGIQVRMEILAFAGLLATTVWAFFGARAARAVAFPAAFLLFCLPLSTYLDVVTVHLRLFATSFAYELLHGCGADIVRTGTMLGAADGSFAIDVASPCSGLRSLFALMALTAGYAYLVQPTWWRRGLLFALSIPIAVLGNVVRVVSIVAVGKFCSPAFATGFYHDYSGYIVFLAAIALMLCASGAIAACSARLRARQ